jgi:type III secretion protein R
MRSTNYLIKSLGVGCLWCNSLVAKTKSLELDPNLFSDQFSFLLLLVGIALLPFFAVILTSFTKIVVVLSITRLAIGTAQTPPNIVIMSVAMILTVFSMYPVGLKAYNAINITAKDPWSKAKEAFDQASPTIKNFLKAHAKPEDQKLFLDLLPQKADADDLIILAPAFMISELTLAFQIGFLIYLPFLVIDMVVANILMALGMQMLSPTTISLPFKILLFVLIDGWRLLAASLLDSYAF